MKAMVLTILILTVQAKAHARSVDESTQISPPSNQQVLAGFFEDEQDCHFRTFGSPVLGIAGAIGSDRMKSLLKANCLRLRGYGSRTSENFSPAEVEQLRREMKNAWNSLGDSAADRLTKQEIRAALKNLSDKYPTVQSADLSVGVTR